jgi:Icc-related predicted phosphoesterase
MTQRRIFFASDIHAAEKVYRKFLNAAAFYKADILIHGGDLTGKAVVPVIKRGDGVYEATVFGAQRYARNEAEFKLLVKDITDIGSYAHVTTPEEVAELDADERKRDELFERLMMETVVRWVKLAEEKLAGTSIKCLLTPGNDDKLSIDSALEGSERVINPEGKVIQWFEHEIIATGYSIPTPWKCPRDVPEDQLEARIDAMARQVKNPERAIFCTHDPPLGTVLAQAPQLDKDRRPIMRGGNTELFDAGSLAVKNIINKYKPMISLHGHIHESKGIAKVGNTICINPGSEYAEGILHGAIINLQDGKLKGYMLVQG